MTTTELKTRPRLPEWLRIKLPTSDSFAQTRNLLGELKLHTVCESAKCPNHWECWEKGTATFMIAGDRCTRACGFCAVATAKPLPLEADEPLRVAEATRRMKLKHVVITAVARDDMADGGAEHFRQTIEEVRRLNPKTVIEVLVPDFQDSDASIDAVLAALQDLRAAGCDILTLGQYLQPSTKLLPVKEFVSPEKFAFFKQRAEEMGFVHVASGPMVRSSYHADEFNATSAQC